MKIISGDYEIFEAGTVCSNGMNSVDFILQDNPAMTISLNVIEDSEIKESTIELEVESNSRLVIKYTNPSFQMHFGSAQPIHVGTMQGKKLYATLRVNVFGIPASSYQVVYCFMLGERENG